MNGKQTNWTAFWCVVSVLLLGGCEQEASQDDTDAIDTTVVEEVVEEVAEEVAEEVVPESEPAQPEAPAIPMPDTSPPATPGHAFLAENATRDGVTTTASGLQYEVLASGDGATPGPTDYVTTHYHGTLINGQVFDSSVERGQPIEFPVNGVIAGWTEALQLMRVGDRWKLYIPPELAYGRRGVGGAIGPDETLIFEVELLGVRSG